MKAPARERHTVQTGQDRDKSYDNAERFLLARADAVRLTPVRTFALDDIFTLGRSRVLRKEKEAAALEGLENELVRRVTSRAKHDAITGSGSRVHLLYRLSKRLKRMLHTQTLFWHSGMGLREPGATHPRDFWYMSERFAGLEDPVFFARDEPIGFVITHERMLVLLLTSEERKRLERQGVELDN